MDGSPESGVDRPVFPIIRTEARPHSPHPMSDTPPDLISISNVIIDDIVRWDGQTHMGVLGGSGSHAVAGMRVWHRGSVGISAYIGPDLPVDWLPALASLDLDPQGLITLPQLATPRAWQIFEQDGRRSEIFRTSAAEFFEHSSDFERIPVHWWDCKACHIQVGGSLPQVLPALQRLKAGGVSSYILYEPQEACLVEPPSLWTPVLELADAVFLNRKEGMELTGCREPMDMADRIQTWGGQNLVIGQGPDGALARTRTGDSWQIAAYPVQAADDTGGGNALSGGLLAGIWQGAEFLAAAQMGVVSASFAVSQFGLPADGEKVAQRAADRLQWVRQHTQAVT